MDFGGNAVHKKKVKKKKEQKVLFPYSLLLPAIHENSFLVHKGHLSFMYISVWFAEKGILKMY